MTSQIFKATIPNKLLFDLLEENAIKAEKFYIVNNNVYKKGIFNESLQKFMVDCRQYYHLSKRKYLDRKLTYNSFVTILRQICNYNNITYTSQIKYDKSVYDIVYNILYFTHDL
jgi:hypothetical protein